MVASNVKRRVEPNDTSVGTWRLEDIVSPDVAGAPLRFDRARPPASAVFNRLTIEVDNDVSLSWHIGFAEVMFDHVSNELSRWHDGMPIGSDELWGCEEIECKRVTGARVSAGRYLGDALSQADGMTKFLCQVPNSLRLHVERATLNVDYPMQPIP